jgi:hypothetical protein
MRDGAHFFVILGIVGAATVSVVLLARDDRPDEYVVRVQRVGERDGLTQPEPFKPTELCLATAGGDACASTCPETSWRIEYVPHDIEDTSRYRTDWQNVSYSNVTDCRLTHTFKHTGRYDVVIEWTNHRTSATRLHNQYVMREIRQYTDAELVRWRKAWWTMRNVSTSAGRNPDDANYQHCEIQHMRGLGGDWFANYNIGTRMHWTYMTSNPLIAGPLPGATGGSVSRNDKVHFNLLTSWLHVEGWGQYVQRSLHCVCPECFFAWYDHGRDIDACRNDPTHFDANKPAERANDPACMAYSTAWTERYFGGIKVTQRERERFYRSDKRTVVTEHRVDDGMFAGFETEADPNDTIEGLTAEKDVFSPDNVSTETFGYRGVYASSDDVPEVYSARRNVYLSPTTASWRVPETGPTLADAFLCARGFPVEHEGETKVSTPFNVYAAAFCEDIIEPYSGTFHFYYHRMYPGVTHPNATALPTDIDPAFMAERRLAWADVLRRERGHPYNATDPRGPATRRLDAAVDRLNLTEYRKYLAWSRSANALALRREAPSDATAPKRTGIDPSFQTCTDCRPDDDARQNAFGAIFHGQDEDAPQSSEVPTFYVGHSNWYIAQTELFYRMATKASGSVCSNATKYLGLDEALAANVRNMPGTNLDDMALKPVAQPRSLGQESDHTDVLRNVLDWWSPCYRNFRVALPKHEIHDDYVVTIHPDEYEA